MAKRYGGKYSPDGDMAGEPTPREDRAEVRAYKGAKVAPAGARSNVLFIPGLLLAFFSINEAPVDMAVGLLGAGALVLGAWLLRDGLRPNPPITNARSPAVPPFRASCSRRAFAGSAPRWRPGPRNTE